MLAATLVVAGSGSAYGHEPLEPVAGVTGVPASSAAAQQITLITGDVVTVTNVGGKPAVTVTPHRANSLFRTYSIGSDIYVQPLEAQPLIASGQVDRRLFNVTELIAQGYDDAHSTSIPLIVRYPKKGAGKAAAPAAPAGSRKIRDLPSVRGAAVAAEKKQAAAFWEAVDDDTAEGRGPKAKLSGGIEHIWLDGKVNALLDVSVPQIGAPEAWAAGYDGTGVKVAVLDTGVDPNHPDLAGQIVDSQSFVPGEAVQDGHGHGTHVATTIAGTGAASGGKYKGVAPGAKLVIGKVMSNAGSGYDSQIIAGMEWAAHSGAKVISMSLGGTPDADTTPTAEAVNELTAETGVLFTIAAGNAGQNGAKTLGSPGIAEAALTVGAVDGADAVTYFSSRGPTPGGRLKPEITAPGWKIIAGRASGTTMGAPVDDFYTAASGTSMATPHVAGAAALLAGQHPDWTAPRLKSQLISTAKTTPGAPVYDQGAGRTDVGRAVRQSVSGSGVVDFGTQDWDTTSKSVKPITYFNDGDQPVTLALTVKGDGSDLPAGALALGADTVTVPAHGTADVTVRLDPTILRTGTYGAHVAAASADGATVVTTAVGVVKDVERFNVSVKLIDLDGKAPAETYSIMWYWSFSDSTVGGQYIFFGADGTVDMRLPRGEYAFVSATYRNTPGFNQVRDYVYGAESGVVIDADRTITFDGRKSNLVTVDTPKPSQARQVRMGLSLMNHDKSLTAGLQEDLSGSTRLHAIPSQLGNAAVEHRLNWSLTARAVEAQIVSTEAFPIAPEYVDGWIGSPHLDGTQVLRVVDAGIGRPQDYAGKAAKGALALVRRNDEVDTGTQIDNAAKAGAGAIIIYNDVPADWGLTSYSWTPAAIPAMTLNNGPGARLAGLAAHGDVRIKFRGTAVSPYTYEVLKYQQGILPDQHHRVSTEELATVETSFHASARDTEGGYGRFFYTPQQAFLVMTRARVVMPQFVMQYVTAGTLTIEIMAPASVRESLPGDHQTGLAALRPGQRATQIWNKAVVRTAITASTPEGALRQGDVGVMLPVGLLDGATGQVLGYRHGADKELTTVYRDGQLLGNAATTQVAFPMTAERAQYRVVMDVQRDLPAWTTSTKVNTAWTFHSEHTEKALLPVISVDYDLDVDLNNSAKAASMTPVNLGFRYPHGLDGLRIKEAKLWASYDDGATWQRVTLTSTGAAGATGKIQNPRLRGGNGFVTLRVQATDADGNTVEQTVTRAYQLR
ncbi:S8 family serine peptidase [Dactylosporangium sp. NBC_01737]|uniref:S8 family serine peptidase n=1 Tax=Dactylosporangium sp. NBC_01737 TaxID=2975959 RepID=UPI002E1548D5|nr:S8 family serine peptidase [Dactylosporangium sp. NBC_01737]